MVGARPEIGRHGFRSFPSFASGPVPRCGQYSILSGSEAYTCSLLLTVHQGLFPPPFSAHSCRGKGVKGRESTEHLSHWREFRPHPIPNSCSPRMIVLGELLPRTIVSGEQQPLRHSTDLWANGSHFGQVSYKETPESQKY
jgi:hypothetical protein